MTTDNSSTVYTTLSSQFFFLNVIHKHADAIVRYLQKRKMICKHSTNEYRLLLRNG